VPAGEIGRWETENDPINRYMAVLTEQEGVTEAELRAIDQRVSDEIDVATDAAEASPMPEPTDALVGIYAEPPAAEPLWYRAGVRSAVESHERPAAWGTAHAE
jgi:TPP-dependent pyruvate/acetoin dehydrogenase alpha subunit